MTPPKENNSPEIDSDLKKICEMLEKELQIMISKESQWYVGESRYSTKTMREIIQDKNNKFIKEIEIIKNESDILKLNTLINEVKNTTESFYNCLQQAEERTSEHKNRSFELTQSEKNIKN